MKKILVTGGAGYIGSHTALALIQAGYEVVLLDNLCNSSVDSVKRVARLTGRNSVFIQGDVRDRALIDRLFVEHTVGAVLHLAGLKAVAESVNQPLRYYDTNVHGSQVLLQACARAAVFNIVFSSSATVYGEPGLMPISETCHVSQPSNPYGRSKLIVEEMLRDVASTDPRWRVAILRYFNPVGAHESGQIGEDPNGVPNNLLPYISQVAIGRLSELAVFGNDYPTPDGTCVRDYIHVVDLAEGHLCALEALRTRKGLNVWNLGTGKGYSVMEIIRAFEFASGKSIPYRIAPRRRCDTAVCYADPRKAEQELGWKAKRGLDEIMQDSWRWQRMNPNGYRL